MSMITRFIICVLSLHVCHSQLQTKMVINFFRHGARLPYVPNHLELGLHEDPLIDDSDLTPIGMRQQYLLGRAIREKYRDFLDPQYNYANVEVYSSNRRRAIVSALC